MRHGRGTYTDPAGKVHECIFYLDCEIRLGDQNPDCWGLAPLNAILALSAVGLVAAYLNTPPYENGEGYLIGAAIFYIIMLIETCCTSTASFLKNIITYEEAQHHLNRQRQHPPVVKFSIQNYHYDTIVEYHNGNVRTRQVRVNTHYAVEHFRYSSYCDTSADPVSIEFVKATKLCRLKIGLLINYTAQSSQSYNCQEHNFKHHNI